MNNSDILSDRQMDALFEEVRENAPLPSQDLWTRVLSDADAFQPAAAGLPKTTPATGGLFASLMAAIGGWPSVAGLVTATMAGLWFGFTNPETLSESSVALLLTGSEDEVLYDLEDFAPSFGGLSAMLEEG